MKRSPFCLRSQVSDLHLPHTVDRKNLQLSKTAPSSIGSWALMNLSWGLGLYLTTLAKLLRGKICLMMQFNRLKGVPKVKTISISELIRKHLSKKWITHTNGLRIRWVRLNNCWANNKLQKIEIPQLMSTTFSQSCYHMTLIVRKGKPVTPHWSRWTKLRLHPKTHWWLMTRIISQMDRQNSQQKKFKVSTLRIWWEMSTIQFWKILMMSPWTLLFLKRAN